MKLVRRIQETPTVTVVSKEERVQRTQEVVDLSEYRIGPAGPPGPGGSGQSYTSPELVYDEFGRITSVTYAEGAVVTLTYPEEALRLTSPASMPIDVATLEDGPTLRTKTFYYDIGGRLEQVVDS